MLAAEVAFLAVLVGFLLFLVVLIALGVARDALKPATTTHPGARHSCKESTMSIRPRRLGRAAALLVTATVVLLAAAGAAHADQATATTQVIDETATIPFTNPCNGETGTATITYKVIFHQTDRPVDTYSLVDNLSGDFVLVLDSGATITGHFVETGVIGGGENLTLSSVLTAQGTASDGSHFSLHFQVIQAENGLGVLVVDLAMC